MTKSNCTICRNRTVCPNYQLGGLLIDSNCDQFKEEKELSEEEQIQLEVQLASDNPMKNLMSRLMKAVRKFFG